MGFFRAKKQDVFFLKQTFILSHLKSILSVFIYFASFTFFGQTPIKNIQNISDKIQVKVNKLISDYSPTVFVNPFIGTGGHGHTYPGASAPFGMMQLSPDTRYDGWDGCSGYHYSDSIIYGFSHSFKWHRSS